MLKTSVISLHARKRYFSTEIGAGMKSLESCLLVSLLVHILALVNFQALLLAVVGSFPKLCCDYIVTHNQFLH